jgi:hypothetical protein
VTSWQIKASHGQCSTCSREFREEESYISNVTETEDGFERTDHCLDCWANVDQDGSYFFWKAVHRPNRRRNIFVDNATLMNFFTRLEEEDSDIKKNFRYLLSLILMRKKLLVFKDVFKEGALEYMVVRDREDREYRVLNPNMDLNTIEDVKTQMMAVLHQDMFEKGLDGPDTGDS